MVAADLQQHERGASDLHRGVRPGEDPRTIGECLGNGRGHQQRQQHGGEHQAPDARRLRVEPVADPARVLPAEPDREPQHQGLQHAGQVHVMQQMVAELGDREHVDQVEEQFFVGHAGMMAIAVAQRGQAQSGTHATPSARRAPVQETGQQRRHGEHQQQDRQLFAYCVTGPADPHPHVGHGHQKPVAMKAISAVGSCEVPTLQRRPNSRNTPSRSTPPSITMSTCMVHLLETESRLAPADSALQPVEMDSQSTASEQSLHRLRRSLSQP